MPLKPTDKKKITKNFEKIVKGLYSEHIIDSLISDGLISLDDNEQIRQKATRSGQNRELILRLINGPERGFHSFLETLRKDKGCQHLAEEIFKTEVPEEKPWKIDIDELSFKSTDIKKISRNFEEIVENLDLNKIIDSLISNEVLSLDDLEQIDAKPTQRQKNRQFVQLLTRGPERRYHIFLKCLKNHETYENLADTIDKTNVHEEKRETIERWIGKEGLPAEKANKPLTKSDLERFSRSINPKDLSMVAPFFDYPKCNELLCVWKQRLGQAATADKLLELLFTVWSASNGSIDETEVLHAIKHL